MANVEHPHRLRDLFIAIKEKLALIKKGNDDLQAKLDPNDLNRLDPNDTALEAKVEASRNFDPIDTPVEAENENDYPRPKI